MMTDKPTCADATLLTWTSPSEVNDMMFDVRAPGVTGLAMALLRPRAKGRDNSVLSLAYAKLNPIEPGAASPTTRCGMPTTARDHRLALATGVADPVSIERLLCDYDRAVPEHQRLLAAVMTIKFERDRPLHDQFDAVTTWVALDLARARQLTCVSVLHVPGDQLATEMPHAHVVVCARRHHASGWADVHEELNEDAHAIWAQRWLDFNTAWRRMPG